MKSKIILVMLPLILFSCKKNDATTTTTDIQESAQQVGDVMASVDEAGGTSGSIAGLNKSIQNTFDRFATDTAPQNKIAQIFISQAQAASCAGAGFSSCTAGVITRNFSGCTVGTAVFSGTVGITWSNGATCALGATSESVTRSPNFTVTGRRGATLTVTKSGTFGQRLTWASGAGASKIFSLTNDGINRNFSLNSTTLFDQTTTITSPVTVTGTARSSRIMTGGSLRVTNNLTSVTCDYVPTNVTWSTSTCNCPISGSWAGTCSDNKTTTLAITGCGTASYTEGTTTEAVVFDRCGS